MLITAGKKHRPGKVHRSSASQNSLVLCRIQNFFTDILRTRHLTNAKAGTFSTLGQTWLEIILALTSHLYLVL
jgi:hypothetical protein